MIYYRPLVQRGALRPEGARLLAGGPAWFTHAAALARDAPPHIVAADDLPPDVLAPLTAPRPPVAGLPLDRPRIMAILNATPDSFSDGGLHDAPEAALRQGRRLIAEGADILDIGGESTRPGATLVPTEAEIARTAPLIATLRAGWDGPISIDTRKAAVARAALDAGARFVNDVSALRFDPDMPGTVAATSAPVCLMHSPADPETMQADPRYDDVTLDVYDHLAARIAEAVAAGIPRARIVVDPGIGFGKTLEHNLRLLADLSLFHGLGCPILLGASRKRFIGTIGGAPEPRARMAGSLAVALHALAQGVQILRVHDMAATRQAVSLWRACETGERP